MNTARDTVDRRKNDYPVWGDRRQSPRRVSPAIGENAIQECARLRSALRAIHARVLGEFDDPALVACGPLQISSTDDVLLIARRALGWKSRPTAPVMEWASATKEPTGEDL